MNDSVKPEKKPDPAAKGAADGAAAANGKSESWLGTIWNKISEFIGSFSENGAIGSILGGIIGLGGAWLAGNFFGGGIMSTILTIALAIPLMLVGSDSIGGWINDTLGTDKTPAAGEEPSKDKTPGRAVAKTQEELQQKLTAIQQELEAANRVAERRLRSGQLTGVTAEALQKAQDNAKTLLREIQAKIPSATTPELIANTDRLLTIMGATYDNIIGSNPTLQAEVRTEYEAIRTRTGSGADAQAEPTPVGPAKHLTNEELNAIIAAPDNLKDRAKVRTNGSNAPTVVSVADSDPEEGVIRVERMLENVAELEARRAAQEGRAAQPITGITFTPMSDGKISYVGTTVGTLPSTAGQGR